MKLKKGESIVTAWAEYVSGPGWSNQLVWVVIRTPDGFREDCIQPEDQTPEMKWLFSISSAANRSMVAAVKAVPIKPKVHPHD